MGNVVRGCWPLFVAGGFLVGCGSAEDRINAAVPVSAEVDVAWAALDAASEASADTPDAEAQYGSQLKQRALACSDGYVPSGFASKGAIRAAVGDAACFAAADTRLLQWIGMRRASLLAAMPPLRAVPERPPAILAGAGRIDGLAAADAAGVVLFRSGGRYQLLDATNGATIRGGELPTRIMPALSPNGRLLGIGTEDAVRLQEAETGAALATVDAVRGARLHWAGDRGVVYLDSDGKVAFHDWASGTGSAVPMEVTSLAAVVPVPRAADTFVLLGGDRAATVQLDCNAQGCSPRLLRESRLGNSAAFASEVVVDANNAFFTRGDTLQQLDLLTLEMQAISFKPMMLTGVAATGEPGTLLIKAYLRGAKGGPQQYLFSVAERTVAQVETERLLSPRLAYVPALRRSVVVDGAKLVTLDRIPAGRPSTLAALLTAQEFDAQVARLDTLDRYAALRASRGAPGDPQRAIDNAVAAAQQAAMGSPPARALVSPPSPAFPPGEAGLADAIRAGVLRPGNTGDIDAWKASHLAKTGRSPGRGFDDMLRMRKIYVVTGDMVLPSGLHGAHSVVFVIGRDAPYPRGDSGHSPVLDIRSGSCGGVVCSMVSP